MIMTFLSYQRSAQDELATERKPLTTESEVAIKMHIHLTCCNKVTPLSNLPTTSWYTQKMLFNKKTIGIACPISILFHPVSPFHLMMSPSFTISLDQVTIWASSPWPVGPVSDPATNPNRDDSGRIPLTVMKSFEKSLTPGLPTFLGIAGCHTKIRHLSLEKNHKKLLLGSAQQIGWEW